MPIGELQPEVKAAEGRRTPYRADCYLRLKFDAAWRVIFFMSQDLHRDTPWPHAPVHRLGSSGIYFVTGATYQKAHHFRGRERIAVLHRGLLKLADQYGWILEAWAVFSNHYHFVARSPADAATLLPMLKTLHVRLSGWVNKLDGTPGRKVWHQYRDTLLTYEKSYLARLNYGHQNAVKHRLVSTAGQYPWCSAGWLERTADPATLKTIYGFQTDTVNVEDEYDPSPEW